jgi:hypothetical protein
MNVTKQLCKILIVYFFITDRYWFYKDILTNYDSNLEEIKNQLVGNHHLEMLNNFSHFLRGNKESQRPYKFNTLLYYDFVISMAIILIISRNWRSASFLVITDSLNKIFFCLFSISFKLQTYNFKEIVSKISDGLLRFVLELITLISKEYILCLNFGLIIILFILSYQLDREYVTSKEKNPELEIPMENQKDQLDLKWPPEKPSMTPQAVETEEVNSLSKIRTRDITPSKRREVLNNF